MCECVANGRGWEEKVKERLSRVVGFKLRWWIVVGLMVGVLGCYGVREKWGFGGEGCLGLVRGGFCW